MNKGTARVLRFNPDKDIKPYYETYEFPFEKGMTVLDLAFYIYEEIDGTFSFSYCCRNSHCGVCGANVNGTPSLMCREPLSENIILEPLNNLPVIRDLVIDRDIYESSKYSLRLFLDRVNPAEKIPEKIEQPDHEKYKIASRCVECFSCLSGCPSVRESPHEFLGPTGLVQLARYFHDPRDDLNREVLAAGNGLFNCTTCGYCEVVCPHGISPVHNIALMKQCLVERGMSPPSVTKLAALTTTTDKAIQHPLNQSSFLESYADTNQGKVGLFVGCNFDYDTRLIPVAEDTVKLLKALDLDLVVPAKQICCGIPLKEVGITKELADLAVRNVEIFREAGCTLVLTICSGCGLGAKEIWPQLYKKVTGRVMPFTVKDINEFIMEASVPWERLKHFKAKVAYHDPCTLKRGQGIFKEPRALLSSIPGLQVIEMDHEDYCCGGGGNLRLNNFDLSRRILKQRLNYILDKDVDAIVTSCPTCIKMFSMGLAKKRIKNINVLHPVTILSRAMELYQEGENDE